MRRATSSSYSSVGVSPKARKSSWPCCAAPRKLCRSACLSPVADCKLCLIALRDFRNAGVTALHPSSVDVVVGQWIRIICASVLHHERQKLGGFSRYQLLLLFLGNSGRLQRLLILDQLLQRRWQM